MGTSKRTRRTPEKDLDAFIEALAEGLTIKEACERSGVPRRTAYDNRQADETFALRWADAIVEGNEGLEAEARRRAVTGTVKPVFQGGLEVGGIREYSDTLLIFLMKGRMPDKYRDNVKIDARIETVGDDALERNRAAGLDEAIEAEAIKFARLLGGRES